MILDNLRYRTFSELMASVSSDLDVYADNLMIDDSKLIKVVRKVNADLGLRINSEKETVVDIVNHKAILPSDFQYLQLALLCYASPKTSVSKGVDAPTFEHNVLCGACKHDCSTGKTTLCPECFTVTESNGYDLTIHYDVTVPVRLTKKSHRLCADSCMNLPLTSDKYKYTLDLTEKIMTIDGVKNGKLYLNYLSDMVNEDGEIIILDNPLVNDYYEYAIKTRIFENFALTDKVLNVQNKLQLVNERTKEARIEAMNFVYMPE